MSSVHHLQRICILSEDLSRLLPLEMLSLRGFHYLTPGDLKWPLASTKNSSGFEFSVEHLGAKYEILV